MPVEEREELGEAHPVIEVTHSVGDRAPASKEASIGGGRGHQGEELARPGLGLDRGRNCLPEGVGPIREVSGEIGYRHQIETVGLVRP